MTQAPGVTVKPQAPGVTVKPQAPGVTVKPQEHDSGSWCNSQASGSWCNSHTSLFHTHYLKGVIPKPAMFYAAFFTLQECKQSRYRNSILFLTELGLPGLLCDSTEQIAWKYMKMPVKTCTKNISLPVISLCSWQFVGFFFFSFKKGLVTSPCVSLQCHITLQQGQIPITLTVFWPKFLSLTQITKAR